MNRGYIRVSTKDQRYERQLHRLKNAGVEAYYCEKASGKSMQRKEFDRMMGDLQPGDVVIITDMTRISRNTRDLLGIIETIRIKQAAIKSIDDPWLDTTDANPFQDFLITVMAGLAELERRLTVQRINEGLAAARAAGRIGGRPKVKDDIIQNALTLHQIGIPIKKICELTLISRSTLYNYIRTAKNTLTPSGGTAPPAVFSANANEKDDIMATDVKTLTEKLEQSIKDIFNDQGFKDYLKTMSIFHNYSYRNIALIKNQCPDATCVSGFTTWKKLDRYVKKGEKGIGILAPIPLKTNTKVNNPDPQTGEMVTQEAEQIRMHFKVVYVYDVSQTDGAPLPALPNAATPIELTGDVPQFDQIIDALRQVSPYPINFEAIKDGQHQANGYCDNLNHVIVIDDSLSNAMKVKTCIHEVAHARMHAANLSMSNRRTKEVEAESVAYVVTNHYGIDSSDYSFAYVAGWSSSQELRELKASLQHIQAESQKLIEDLDTVFKELKLTQTLEQDAPQNAQKPSLKETLLDIKADQVQNTIPSPKKEHQRSL